MAEIAVWEYSYSDKTALSVINDWLFIDTSLKTYFEQILTCHLMQRKLAK